MAVGESSPKPPTTPTPSALAVFSQAAGDTNASAEATVGETSLNPRTTPTRSAPAVFSQATDDSQTSPEATVGECPSSLVRRATESIPVFGRVFPNFPRGSAVPSSPTVLASPDAAGPPMTVTGVSHSVRSWASAVQSPASATTYSVPRGLCARISIESVVYPMTMAGASPPLPTPPAFPAGDPFPEVHSSTSTSAAALYSGNILAGQFIPVTVPHGSAVPPYPTMPAADRLQGVYFPDYWLPLLALVMLGVISFLRYVLGLVRLFRD